MKNELGGGSFFFFYLIVLFIPSYLHGVFAFFFFFLFCVCKLLAVQNTVFLFTTDNGFSASPKFRKLIILGGYAMFCYVIIYLLLNYD